MNKKLKDGLNQTETIKGYLKMIIELKGDLNDSKNIKVPKVKKVSVTEKGRFMTTCLICQKTCHGNCCIKDDDDKSRCACIKNGNWQFVKIIVIGLNIKIALWNCWRRSDEKKYYNSKNNLDVKIQLLMGAKNDLIKLNLECIQTQQEMMMSVNRLKEIALNKSIFESVEEHIDELIINEKNENKEGWQTRVTRLEIMKEQKKKLREIY